LPVATQPVIRDLLDQARKKNYRAGVLGVQARPEVVGQAEFDHDSMPVRVVGCGSALAVREALLARDPAGWLVVLTDREETDLGYGLLGRMVWHRLRRPDPWSAVRQRFAASGIDPALTTGPANRDHAAGLLAATPDGGWPPAPGGVLTRDHAFGALARAHLGLGLGPGSGLGADGVDVDAAAVLHWSVTGGTAERIADLRALAGDPLTDAVLDWVAGRTGACAAPLRLLLAAGAVGDAVPLGVVASLLVAGQRLVAGQLPVAGHQGGGQVARDALIRLEARLGTVARDLPALRAWGGEATAVAAELLRQGPDHRATANRVLGQADTLLHALDAGALAALSDLLPAGLTSRLARLGDALRTGADLAAVERAWDAAEAHHLAAADGRRPPVLAAVRLARWLATGTPAGPDLSAQVGRYRDTCAWVDSAVADAARGVSDPELGSALSAVLRVVRQRRHAHDRVFAAALAAHTRDDPAARPGPSGRGYRGVRHLEDLLPDVVLPLARQTPTLLLVMDGMSVAVATEVMADLLAEPGWAECLLPGEPARAAALAVLPTVTDVSRASLLCGELCTGGQDRERRGYGELVRAYGLERAVLFHKGLLDSTEPGHALNHDVAGAVDDVPETRLVTCVLNAIDDALDRSDPGGTGWGREAIRHLRPLLDRAHRVGRTVVLTSDHGHVIERRAGTQRPYPGISSGRSRPGGGNPPGDGEVLVTGRRVLRHDGRAVLAVDETLRYGPLKAGYHGGAAPAEAVVPVCVLVPSVVPEGTGLREAGPQAPAWWYGPAATAATAATAAAVPVAGTGAVAGAGPPALFEVAPASRTPEAVADAVVASAVYRAHRRVAGRVAVSDGQVCDLLVALLADPARRLRPHQAATALQVAPSTLRDATAQAIRLLNVEGFTVLGVDPDGETVVLDEQLLREQFEVPV
jgi:hypothetical protein